MDRFDRLPAVPLITSDPYMSVWMPADTMTGADSAHWSGPVKALRGIIEVDGKPARFLGLGDAPEARPVSQAVLPTRTLFAYASGGVRIDVCFAAPAFPDDPDMLSMPVTLFSAVLSSDDGAPHDVKFSLFVSDALCYDGEEKPEMIYGGYELCGFGVAWCGQAVQKPLSHSGDHITQDWGYLYLASSEKAEPCEGGLSLRWQGAISDKKEIRTVIAYDDIASINYFGDLCKPWYRRNGANITDAIKCACEGFDSIIARCEAWDARVLSDAEPLGEDYKAIVSAGWRHTFAAHKLIASPEDEMVLLSKENDSNGCIGTADVSYPSIPIFLKYNPELVNALCRPILKFASLPVWEFDFAPHDVGRYPNATGQVYAAKGVKNGFTHPPYYLYPAGCGIYDFTRQMPVEECGNMIIMLAAAIAYGADGGLAEKYRPILDKWALYLEQYGEDPGEQLCTDDFAGHLAHNVNLAAKAIVGAACYAKVTGSAEWDKKAHGMAARFAEKVGTAGDTPLTLDGSGWSMKYNLLWDRLLGLDLLPESFYAAETKSYLKRMNAYGLPLDSRADYTKADWICWTAAMCPDKDDAKALLAPIAGMLRESQSRVAFSDWYDTRTGLYVHFIARSVIGGVFAPMLAF